jgi:FkbM family methyltransferase
VAERQLPKLHVVGSIPIARSITSQSQSNHGQVPGKRKHSVIPVRPMYSQNIRGDAGEWARRFGNTISQVEHSMKKVGEYWVPDVDMSWFKNRAKTEQHLAGQSHMNAWHIDEAIDAVREIRGEQAIAEGVAIDAGANVGAYARRLAQVFAHVHAFEPAPDTFECLKQNIQDWSLDSKVTVYPNALSSHEEKVRMGTQLLRNSRSRSVQGPGNISAITIDGLRLAGVVFIKLDVEGYEEKVLSGAKETLLAQRPIVMMEVHEHKEHKRERALAAHDLITSMGYKVVKKIGSPAKDWIYAM